jgi:hypothetical protein
MFLAARNDARDDAEQRQGDVGPRRDASSQR